MLFKTSTFILSGIARVNAQAQAQGPAPAPVLLAHTMSGVVPVAPTPFPGVETIEGALIYDGVMKPGFTGVNGDAVVQQNTAVASYIATLPTVQFDPYVGSTIQGSIIGTAPANGTGVMFSVNFTGLPSELDYGPFVYHIHNLPISADGNCTASLGHLDPTDRGELYPCDDTNPQSCQAGDLSGKHGNITMSTFSSTYVDLYLSTTPGSPYYFGDKSIVIHSTNVTRLTCANFTMASSTATGTGSPSGATASSTSSATGVSYTGAASKAQVAMGLVGGTAAALAACLL